MIIINVFFLPRDKKKLNLKSNESLTLMFEDTFHSDIWIFRQKGMYVNTYGLKILRLKMQRDFEFHLDNLMVL